ncbi:MAG: hypothetical protein J3K34DRAFT_460676 [Monoraphidium minutum]|nr:MAG: hypothetical protein J3K34DRAFT_460676 [Monoraphidium minutum]
MGCASSSPADAELRLEVEKARCGSIVGKPMAQASETAEAPPIARQISDVPELRGAGDNVPRTSSAPTVPDREALQVAPRTISFDVLNQVQHMQRQLAMVNPIPALGLLEATELLARRLRTPLVSVMAFAPPDASGARAAVLLSAHGRGALVLEQWVVMEGRDWSAARVLEKAAAAGHDALEGAIVYSSDEAGDDLPRDWRALRQDAGLSSFAVALLGSPDAPLGALLVARPEAAEAAWWTIWLGVAATGLLHIVSAWQVAFTARMLQRLDGLEDRVDFIASLLQSASVYMLKSANLRMGLRLALLEESDRSKALVFRSRSQERSDVDMGPGGRGGDRRSSAVSQQLPLLDPGEPDVVAGEMAVAGTLLESAVTMLKARFVRDCTVYLQTCATPARDMFITAEEPVAAIVVVPLVVKEVAFGALYFTLEAPSDFTNLQEALLGFVASVTLMAHNKLAGYTRVLWGAVSEAQKVQSARLPKLDLSFGPRSGPISAGSLLPAPAGSKQRGGARGARGQGSAREGGSASGGGLLRLLDESDGEHSGTPYGSQASVDALVRGRPSLAEGVEEGDEEGGSEDDGGGAATGGSLAASSGAGGFGSNCVLGTVSSRRLSTEAMMRVVAGEIQRNRRAAHGAGAAAYASDLVLERPIGSGGFGAVYRGTWKKTTAAIKVFYARQSEREALKDAVEMAVLSTVNHPNIVQVYSCLTDMVEMPDNESMSASLSGSTGCMRPRYRKLLPGEEDGGPVCSIVVMEYCEHGSLRDAIKRGAFHRQMAGGMLGVDVRTVVEVLLEVAEAIRYLHSLKLLHCDVKIENILLKADITRALGFVPKLADFGLVKVLPGDGGYIRNRSGAGTVSYLAPECFEAGSRLTTGVDAYAFGILMYELYTGRRPYEGLTKDAIVSRVHKQQLRPHLPSATPAGYRGLAQRCWAHDPDARPRLDEVVAELSRIAEELNAGSAAAAAAAAAAAEQQHGAPPRAATPPPDAAALAQQQARAQAAAVSRQQADMAAHEAAAAATAARRAQRAGSSGSGGGGGGVPPRHSSRPSRRPRSVPVAAHEPQPRAVGAAP